jgi:hypothetical protein
MTETVAHRQRSGRIVSLVLLALLMVWPGVPWVASTTELFTKPEPVVGEMQPEVEGEPASPAYYRARLTLDAAMREARVSAAQAQ